MSRIKQPEVGNKVRVYDVDTRSGIELERTGVVTELLSAQFIYTPDGGNDELFVASAPRFCLYQGKWEVMK